VAVFAGIRNYSKQSRNGEFKLFKKKNTLSKKILIIGAGNAGEKLLREIMENPGTHYDVVGFIDDNPRKIQHAIHGVYILGTLQQLSEIVKEGGVDELIIAAPSASAMQMRRMVNFCKETGLVYKTLPGLYELVEGKFSVSAIREVRYEDLLGREPVHLEMDIIGKYLAGKRVLVTGGAGSIGSELCRQIAQFKPEKLILVDRNESGLYEMELELLSQYPDLNTYAVLSAIQHNGRLGRVFESEKPQVVFHAAAYKHVPMMENYPWEAVYNNIVGSWAILDFCQKHKVERCVVVSTDKAVRPTNVMGASKRMVELLMQAYSACGDGLFMAVRFGNVVGSIGSVVPLFRRQIERGGPVTVTHPEVTRYFMTIPEACSLVLQAGAIGKGGEIFVLKMGTPIRIADMANDIITLSGFKPGEDIEIKFTGLRPGEKLYEELMIDGEDVVPTAHEDITVLNNDCCLPLEVVCEHIEKLMALAKKEDSRGIKEELKRIVPEYEPQF
jgi:FlaA1/EpsC-like NDP-sugar epimerase